MNVEVVPPDVNTSDVEFAVEDGKIHFGLAAVKGCGGAAAEALVAARKNAGKFKDLFDFCERVDPSACNRATIETLVKAGAFDSLGARRAQLPGDCSGGPRSTRSSGARRPTWSGSSRWTWTTSREARWSTRTSA